MSAERVAFALVAVFALVCVLAFLSGVTTRASENQQMRVCVEAGGSWVTGDFKAGGARMECRRG